MTSEGVFDGVLLNIADKNHGLEGFLDEIFGFLERRTDFFDSVEQARGKLTDLFDKYKLIHSERKVSAFRKEQEKLSREPAIQEVFDDNEATGKEEKATVAPPPVNAIRKDSPESTPTAATSSPDSDLISPNSGNGANYEKYSWTQTLAMVEIVVPLPYKNVRGKECDVKITSDSLCVAVRGEVLMEGKLSDKIQVEDSFWLISDGNALSITLEKVNKMQWWNRCLMSEVKKIDTSKVMPENSKLADLDPETRQTVEKMMFEQQQKALGKPVNSAQAEILEKLKKAHPELDFSKAKMNF